MNIQDQIASYLLQSKAIKLDTAKPFNWASGWKSPIYCDNRITLSYPEIRDYIRDKFVDIIKDKYPECDNIAGVATGAIAQGVLVADKMDFPFVYVRPKAKSHGRENMIEGELKHSKKVVVIEDLISTGGSSLNAVKELRKAGAEVLGMLAIFSYGFDLSVDNFKESNCPLDTLGNYESLIETAVKINYIEEEKLEILKNWRKDPANWNN